MKVCNNCGQSNLNESSYCVNCGQELQQSSYMDLEKTIADPDYDLSLNPYGSPQQNIQSYPQNNQDYNQYDEVQNSPPLNNQPNIYISNSVNQTNQNQSHPQHVTNLENEIRTTKGLAIASIILSVFGWFFFPFFFLLVSVICAGIALYKVSQLPPGSVTGAKVMAIISIVSAVLYFALTIAMFFLFLTLATSNF